MLLDRVVGHMNCIISRWPWLEVMTRYTNEARVCVQRKNCLSPSNLFNKKNAITISKSNQSSRLLRAQRCCRFYLDTLTACWVNSIFSTFSSTKWRYTQNGARTKQRAKWGRILVQFPCYLSPPRMNQALINAIFLTRLFVCFRFYINIYIWYIHSRACFVRT